MHFCFKSLHLCQQELLAGGSCVAAPCARLPAEPSDLICGWSSSELCLGIPQLAEENGGKE